MTTNSANPAGSREHELKCWPGPYDATAAGDKPFEFRINDRNFHVGDTLVLRRWNPDSNEYTGQRQRVRVTYVCGGRFGIPDGYVVMGIKPEASDNPAGSPTASPCPFCGHKPCCTHTRDEGVYVRCVNLSCEFRATGPVRETVPDAVAAWNADRAQRALEVERLQKQCEHFMAECKARGEETLALRERLEMSEASATFAHERSAGLTLDLDRERARAEAAEGLLERAVKYVTEDRAVTPGVTRLARLADEIRRHLSQASPQKERTGKACEPWCGSRERLAGNLPCGGTCESIDGEPCYCTKACRDAGKPINPAHTAETGESAPRSELGPRVEPSPVGESGSRWQTRAGRKAQEPALSSPAHRPVPYTWCGVTYVEHQGQSQDHDKPDTCKKCGARWNPDTQEWGAPQPEGREGRGFACPVHDMDASDKTLCSCKPAPPEPPPPVGAPVHAVEALACGRCKRPCYLVHPHPGPCLCAGRVRSYNGACADGPAGAPLTDWARLAVSYLRELTDTHTVACACEPCMFVSNYNSAHPIGRPSGEGGR